MRRNVIFVVFLSLLVLSFHCVHQPIGSFLEGSNYYLKIPVYNTSNHVTTIDQKQVSYLSFPICPGRVNELVRTGTYPKAQVFLPRGSMVQLRSIKQDSGAVTLVLRSDKHTAEIMIVAKSMKKQRLLFSKVFATSRDGASFTVPSYSEFIAKAKNEADVIRILGPPLSVCEAQGKRYLYYSSWLLQTELWGFESFFVEINGADVIDVFGSI
jgi:hypothetical protein